VGLLPGASKEHKVSHAKNAKRVKRVMKEQVFASDEALGKD
jgi:hypothetical protein